MWSLNLSGRQSRKKYFYKTFETLSQAECVAESKKIYTEFKTTAPWAEDLDLFVSNDDNVGCIRGFNHLWRWQVASKVTAQHLLIA